MQTEKPRQIAVELLKEHAGQGVFIEQLLESRPLAGLSVVDRALVQELTFGVVRWQATLDWLIARKTSGRTQKVTLQILLRLGLYQLFWLQRIPDHAAVNESVELARQLGFGPQSGFINAILRSYIRERDETQKLLADLKDTQPALGSSHPEWLVDRWRSRWGDEKLRKLLQWNNTPPSTFARVNTLRIAPESLLAQWGNEGVNAIPRSFDWVTQPLVYELQSFPSLARLPSFQSGLFYVQDPSTLLSVAKLEPRPGEQILDLCAAPGGKTTFAAQLMNNQGLLVARDPNSNRRELIKENCSRLGVTCVRIESLDGQSGETFDRILVDAPCSNTGVIRRRVDSRWRVNAQEIERIARTQLELLHSSATQLRPGGVLVYSTCSIEPEENESVVQAFLRDHPAFHLDFERTLLPFIDGVDGAYVARLVRTP